MVAPVALGPLQLLQHLILSRAHPLVLSQTDVCSRRNLALQAAINGDRDALVALA
jgi:hypothetical protein